MSQFTIIKHADIHSATLTATGLRAGADQGNPLVAVKAVAPDASGSLGIWECQPGGWPVINRPDTEFCYILSGRATLTDNTSGDTIEVSTGDVVILPPGWTGRWDVYETVRKFYVIY